MFLRVFEFTKGSIGPEHDEEGVSQKEMHSPLRATLSPQDPKNPLPTGGKGGSVTIAGLAWRVDDGMFHKRFLVLRALFLFYVPL